MAAQAQKDLYTALAQAQDQFDEKQAQMQQKREQELQAQFDGLQKQAEKLIDVLFTKPAKFGKDLLGTIHSAVLKPITETLSGAAAAGAMPAMPTRNSSPSWVQRSCAPISNSRRKFATIMPPTSPRGWRFSEATTARSSAPPRTRSAPSITCTGCSRSRKPRPPEGGFFGLASAALRSSLVEHRKSGYNFVWRHYQHRRVRTSDTAHARQVHKFFASR